MERNRIEQAIELYPVECREFIRMIIASCELCCILVNKFRGCLIYGKQDMERLFVLSQTSIVPNAMESLYKHYKPLTSIKMRLATNMDSLQGNTTWLNENTTEENRQEFNIIFKHIYMTYSYLNTCYSETVKLQLILGGFLAKIEVDNTKVVR